MRWLIALLGSLTLWAAPAHAADQALSGPVRAQFLRAYDGDTITVRAFTWVNQTLETVVRVRGIDTPELAGDCDAEKALAKQARDFTFNTLYNAKVITLTIIADDKYGGRVVANVIADGQSLSEALLARGLAKPYTGQGPKPRWCP